MTFEEFGIVPSEIYIKSSSSLKEHQDFFTGEEESYGMFKYADSSNNKEHIYNIFHKKSNKSFQFLFDKNIDGHILIEEISRAANSYNIKSLRNPKFILMFNTTFIVPEIHLKQNFNPKKHRANISDFNNEIEKLVCCPKGGIDKSESSNTTENEVVETSQKKPIGEFGRLGMALNKSPDNRILIVAPMEGTHAHSLGVLAGDIISEIDGETTMGMTISEAIYRSQGEAGTDVNIRIVRNGVAEPIDFTITREVMDVGRWASFDSNASSATQEINEYSGIGVGISKASDGGVYVTVILEGSPAQKAGILEGDIISEIDGETTMGMTVKEIASKMHGRSGTKINIRVVRSNVPEPIDYTITRAVILASETLTGSSEDEDEDEDEYLEEVNTFIDTSVTSSVQSKQQGLHKAGADINVKDTFGETALMRAAEDGHLEAVKALIAAGADINAKDTFGETALMKVAKDGHLEAVKVLIEQAGADVNAVDDGFKETALMKAAENGHLEVMKVLIEAGADVNVKDYLKRTALMKASKDKNLEVMRVLIRYHLQCTDVRNAEQAGVAEYFEGLIDKRRAELIAEANVNAKLRETLRIPERKKNIEIWIEMIYGSQNYDNIDTEKLAEATLELTDTELDETVSNALSKFHKENVQLTTELLETEIKIETIIKRLLNITHKTGIGERQAELKAGTSPTLIKRLLNITHKTGIDERQAELKAGTSPTFEKKIMMNPFLLVLLIVVLVPLFVSLFGIINAGEFSWFVIMRVGVLCTGFYFVSSPLYRKLTCTQKTIAEVVNLEMTRSHSSSSGSYVYTPIFSYNVNGEQIVVRHGIAQSSSPYQIGDILTLFYNPSKPESYYIGGFASGNWARIIFGLVLIGVFYFILIF